jgi:hypothetical protein
VLVALVVTAGVDELSSFPRFRLAAGGAVGVDGEGEGMLVTADRVLLSARDLLRIAIVDSGSKCNELGSIFRRYAKYSS